MGTIFNTSKAIFNSTKINWADIKNFEKELHAGSRNYENGSRIAAGSGLSSRGTCNTTNIEGALLHLHSALLQLPASLEVKYSAFCLTTYLQEVN